MKSLAWGLSLLVLAGGCGGKVVFESQGDGGGGATTSGTGTASTTGVSTGVATGTSSVGTGPGGCTSHAECPQGLCIFATGACASPCDGSFCSSCTPGTICDQCATSSCPGCLDCTAACVPTPPGRCDDDDKCPPGSVCIFGGGVCAPQCGANGTCPDPGTFCQDCVTGSCCGCEDCVSACVGGE